MKGLGLAALTLLWGGCGGERMGVPAPPPGPPPSETAIVVVSGAVQDGVLGVAFLEPLVLQLVEADSRTPLAGVALFLTRSGTTESTRLDTDAEGRVSWTWTPVDDYRPSVFVRSAIGAGHGPATTTVAAGRAVYPAPPCAP